MTTADVITTFAGEPTGLDANNNIAPSEGAATDRASSKSEAILKLLRRKRGATLLEMQGATGWQAHSVRGFLSGTVKKRLNLTLTSEIGTDGVRRYAVAKG